MSDLEDDYSSEGDDDYVPSGGASEGDSGDEDGAAGESGDEEVMGGKIHEGMKSRKLKKKVPKSKDKPRKKKGGIQLEGEEEDSTDIKDTENKEEESTVTMVDKQELERKKEEKEKKRADDLWSSFLSDVGQPKKANKSAASAGGSAGSTSSKTSGATMKSTSKSSSAATPHAAKKETVTVTKVFDFAGEEVRVTEKVSADSKEAKTFLKKQEEDKSSPSQPSFAKKTTAGPSSGVKRPSGLSSVLGQLGKKSKLSTLEKSKMDWNKFKSKEGIEDELTAFVKGKSGYVEKQNFLARADQRQYEQERNLRLAQTKVLR